MNPGVRTLLFRGLYFLRILLFARHGRAGGRGGGGGGFCGSHEFLFEKYLHLPNNLF